MECAYAYWCRAHLALSTVGGLQVSLQEVARIVRQCKTCRSIDPAPMRWNTGRLQVQDCWTLVAIDVTHFGTSKYLSMVDCGPSRFTVWRKIGNEDAEVVASMLQSVLMEFGPPVSYWLITAHLFV